jgi:hypothetical protein
MLARRIINFTYNLQTDNMGIMIVFYNDTQEARNMKQKIIVIVSGLLISAVLLFGVIPVAAADSPATSTAATQQVGKGQLLKRILTIQDQAKLEALIAKGVAAGKLTSAQASKIEAFWTAHHAQFAKANILRRVLGVNNGRPGGKNNFPLGNRTHQITIKIRVVQ